MHKVSDPLGSFFNSTHDEGCSCRNCVEGILRSGGPCQGLRDCVTKSLNSCNYEHDPCIQRIIDSGEKCQSLCSCEADRYKSHNCSGPYECPVVPSPMATQALPPARPLKQERSLGESKDEVKAKQAGEGAKDNEVNASDKVLPVRDEKEAETESARSPQSRLSLWNITTMRPNQLDCSCQQCVENILLHGDKCQTLRDCVENRCADTYIHDPCISAILDSGAKCQSLCNCEASRYPSGNCKDPYTCPDKPDEWVSKHIEWRLCIRVQMAANAHSHTLRDSNGLHRRQ
jgi:hypothetical protein